MPGLPFDSRWLGITVGISYLVTSGLIRLGHWGRWYDQDVHALHPQEAQGIPSYGGLALWAVVWTLFFAHSPVYLGSGPPWQLFIASTLVLMTGILDDYLELGPGAKSLGILLAATWLYWQSDLRFVSDWAFLPDGFQAPWLGYFWTCGWIYVLTNAVNLIDGLDGVATGVSFVSLATLFVTMWWFSLTIKAYVLLLIGLLAASLLGFLPHNWYPARIYLGDTGALFIGFMFASLSVTSLKSISFYSLLFPVLVYMVPLFDVVYATLRRLWSGQPVTQADQDHLHHRLQGLGWPPDQVAQVMMWMTAGFSLLGFLIHWFVPWRQALLLITALAVGGLFLLMAFLGRRK